jgi:hypothetical protein
MSTGPGARTARSKVAPRVIHISLSLVIVACMPDAAKSWAGVNRPGEARGWKICRRGSGVLIQANPFRLRITMQFLKSCIWFIRAFIAV